MPKLDGYFCDGRCGAQIALDPGDNLRRHGWFTTFGPGETKYTCSATCLGRVANALAVDDNKEMTRG